MRILLNPSFSNKLKKIKDKMKPFIISAFEEQLFQIEEYPEQFFKLLETNFYRKEIKSNYYHYNIAYEYNKEKDLLIYWNIIDGEID